MILPEAKFTPRRNEEVYTTVIGCFTGGGRRLSSVQSSVEIKNPLYQAVRPTGQEF